MTATIKKRKVIVIIKHIYIHAGGNILYKRSAATAVNEP